MASGNDAQDWEVDELVPVHCVPLFSLLMALGNPTVYRVTHPGEHVCVIIHNC